jgi:DNA-binding PadR family transcriptional regulator
MDERALLLLGILMMQSQHGYQINEFIEHNLCTVTDMKKPTAYATLDRLSRAGYVETEMEQVGNRPPRRVYAITPVGERQFHELLRQNLAEADRLILPGAIGLIFIDHLAPTERLDYLRKRLADLDRQIALYAQAPAHPGQIGVDLAIGRQLALLHADRAWLTSTIRELARHNAEAPPAEATSAHATASEPTGDRSTDAGE